MRAVNIEVSVGLGGETRPFTFAHIQDVRILRGPNLHGIFWIEGVPAEEMESDGISRMTGNSPINVAAIGDDGEKRVIFCGVLESARIKALNGLNITEFTVRSYSKLLDLTPEVKIFQNPDLTYDEMVKAVISPFEDADAICVRGAGEAIGRMRAQYQETAWAFLLRMAGDFQDVVVSHDMQPGARLYFGFKTKPTSGGAPIKTVEYEMRQDSYGGARGDNDGAAMTLGSGVRYVVKDREVRDIGETVAFLGQWLQIVAIESIWEGGELVHRYTLADAARIKAPRIYNYGIIGASLLGTVSKVKEALVKMSLPAAHSNEVSEVKWHRFSTVYSSPDGSGWYAMPEIGDTLRMCFPTETEDDAYAISAEHSNAAHKKKRAGSGGHDSDGEMDDIDFSDPNNKFFRNAYGKQIALTKNAVIISSGAGSVKIVDGKGIEISTEHDVNISAANDVSLVSVGGAVIMAGEEAVSMEQANARIEMSGESITFKGAEVVTE